MLAWPLFVAANKNAQPIQVKIELSQAFATVGDSLTLTLAVTHSPNLQILSYGPANPVDPFQLKSIEPIVPVKLTKGFVQEGKRYKFSVFQLGEFILGPIQKIKGQFSKRSH